MKIAVSLALSADETRKEQLKTDLIALGAKDVRVFSNDGVTPFYENGQKVNDRNFYVSTKLYSDLTIQPILYSWWKNDLSIKQESMQHGYDVVIALTSADSLMLERIKTPRHGVLYQAIEDDIAFADLNQWITRPSDYSRLCLGWKFLKYAHTDDITFFELFQGVPKSHMLWKLWLDCQNIKVEKI